MRTPLSGIKLRSRSVLLGEYARCTAVLALLIFGSVFWGVLMQATRAVLNLQVVSVLLYAAWEKLPAVVGILCAVLLTLLAALSLSPLSMGCTAWFLGAALPGKKTRRKRSVKWFLYWMKPARASKAADFKLSLLLRKSCLLLLFLLPGLCLVSGGIWLLWDGGVEDNVLFALLACGVLALLAGLGFGQVALQRYFLAQYLLARQPSLHPAEAIRQSITRMENNQGRALLFQLSFLPWFLLCFLLFPIAYVWPYYMQSRAVFAQTLMQQKTQIPQNQVDISITRKFDALRSEE